MHNIFFGATCQKEKSRKRLFCIFHYSLFTLHFSLNLPRDFSGEEIREVKTMNMLAVFICCCKQIDRGILYN